MSTRASRLKIALNQTYRDRKRFLSLTFVLLLTLSCLSILPPLHAEEVCPKNRPVRFAGLDWDSHRFHVGVASFMLKHGFGCEVTSLPGSTITLTAALGRGDVDVMMEAWVDQLGKAWQKEAKRGRVVSLGPNFRNASQGWFVPRYMIEGDKSRDIKAVAPKLKSVQQLATHKHLFKDPEDPTKGRFLNCKLGWNCELVNSHKLKVYGLDKHFTNVRAGTGAALDAAIASAYKQGKPFVTYYWGPTWLLSTYDLIQLEEPAFNPKVWKDLSRGRGSVGVAYPLANVEIGANKRFAEDHPALAGILRRYNTKIQQFEPTLKLIHSQPKAGVDRAVRTFLQTYPQVWKAWLKPYPTAVERIQTELKPGKPIKDNKLKKT